MNLYIGNSISGIDVRDVSVEFSDELIDYIYKIHEQIPIDIKSLCEIDPYGDIEVPKEKLYQIIDICTFILKSTLLYDYKEPAEGKKMLHDFISIAQKAISMDMGIVSVGD